MAKEKYYTYKLYRVEDTENFLDSGSFFGNGVLEFSKYFAENNNLTLVSIQQPKRRKFIVNFCKYVTINNQITKEYYEMHITCSLF